MEIIAIRIKEKNGVARISETVRMRFSLPKSDVQATIQLAPKDGQKLVIVQLEPLAYWTGGLVIDALMGSVNFQPGNFTWQVYNQNDEGIPSAVSLSNEAAAPSTAKAETSRVIARKGPVCVAATLNSECQ
ncbi:hypothetical protein [Marinobacter sp. AC-23]|uniref:hypothetical protein n=1 Tax=Marinobacter sp. AC-23 TaxID=1879031 RepID=UPI0008DC61D8|nr:hypothetical protein [Marinobacter sp. AC-23]OHY82215.1 hypothetical protein BCA33_07945 [Marinobacter sp. AC-23]